MKRFMSVIVALMVSVSVSWAQQSAVESKSEGIINRALDKVSELIDAIPVPDSSVFEIPVPECEEESEPFDISMYMPKKYNPTKESVVKDMSEMWYQLFEETGRIVLAPENTNDIKWDYSGNKVYVFFNDDMFNASGNEDTIALYYTLRNHKPTSGEGVCPVIFLRTNTLNLDKYTYETYMKPVLVHELIHYACALYDDFEGERNHDELFRNCAKNMGAVLGMEIKVSASPYEYDLLVGYEKR